VDARAPALACVRVHLRERDGEVCVGELGSLNAKSYVPATYLVTFQLQKNA
jgi:hypothetical protein